MKVRFKYIMYIAMFFLAYDALNLPMIPLLDRKPISLFLSILFIVVNIDNLLKLKLKRSEGIFSLLIVISLILGLFKGIYLYDGDLIGWKTFLNSMIGFASIYLAFKLYFTSLKYCEFNKSLKYIFYGYTIITILSGVLQLIYVYVDKYVVLKNIFNILLFNNTNYLEYGRIHFLLGEPSFAGGFLYLIYVPIAMYLYKEREISKIRLSVLSSIIILLNILTFSNRFYIDTLVYLIIWALILFFNNSMKVKVFLIGILVSILIIFNLVFVKNIFQLENNNISRIQVLLSEGGLEKDQSFTVRKTLIQSAIKGFIEKPLIGWGSGNYKHVLLKNYQPTSNEAANYELVDYMKSGNAVVSYSFYGTILSENGIIGIGIILCIIIICIRNRYRNNWGIKVTSLFILYIFFQNELNSYSPIIIWLALFNSDINLKLKLSKINKISIITPCYNSEKTIERTIQSVVSQKLDCELEYIIVDGLSNDNTLQIIKKYAEEYPFIKYISEKDNSMTEALNKGFKMATGEIVASINADDMYLESALDSIYKEFSNNADKKIIIANSYFVYDGSNIKKSKNMPRFFTPFTSSILECSFPECAIFFRRECFEKIGYFNENIKYTQDYELYLRQYNAGYRFWYLDVDVSNFYISDTNFSSSIMDKMEAEVLSYIKYKRTFKCFAHSSASKFLKSILGIREYYLNNILRKK